MKYITLVLILILFLSGCGYMLDKAMGNKPLPKVTNWKYWIP